MFYEFMLPSVTAFTINGTLILSIGVIAVVGLLYKYKNNISFDNTESITNLEENENNVSYERYEEISDNLEVNTVEVEEKVESYNKDDEKIKNIN